jgi:hypothetical protein
MESWLNAIFEKHVDEPTAVAVDAIIADMATDSRQDLVLSIEATFIRSGVLSRFESYQKRDTVAVISHKGEVLTIPRRYGKLVAKDPGDPSKGRTHQLGLWQEFSLGELDQHIRALGDQRDVLTGRVAFFANLRRRWAAECPEVKTAGEACLHLGLVAP